MPSVTSFCTSLATCGNGLSPASAAQTDIRDRATRIRALKAERRLPNWPPGCGRLSRKPAGVIEQISDAVSLPRRIVIQEYPVSVMEAVYHVVEHFSMHTGQILFATKMLTGTDLGFYRHLNSGAAHSEPTP